MIPSLDLSLQCAATVTILYSIWAIGHHKARGPAIGAASESIWFVIGIMHDLPFLSGLSIILAVLHIRNMRRWRKQSYSW